MEYEIFKNELKNKAEKLQVILNDKQLEQFYKYMQLLLEWNEKMNLTAITEPNDIILKHFIDSLTILNYIDNGKNVLDIGTGAGFPGIPLKIVKTDAEFTLLDTVINNLNLERIATVHGRAEEFVNQKNTRENYDFVVSRAVARLNVLLEYMLPFTKVGGRCICMKAFDIEEEINEAKTALQILGGEIEKIDEVLLPESDIKRKIVIIKKVKNTPTKYPRKAGTPAKEPIL